MSNKKPWTLINNNSHKVLKFDTKRELIEYAKRKGYEIKPGGYSRHDRTFYIESYEYIPGNR